MSVIKFTTLTSKIDIVADYKILKYSLLLFFEEKKWLFISNTKGNGNQL